MLTTITPYWNRPDTLRVWFEAVKGATVPGLKHIIIFVGNMIPDWVLREYQLNTSFQFIQTHDVSGDFSIGFYHNMGAKLVCTEWMMKMDIDTIPNVRYFKELCELLHTAQPREWFNGGMVYATEGTSSRLLAADKMPLSEEAYKAIMNNLRGYCGNACIGPVATNFICRVKDYLSLGGCDERFRGYGWEDYQQIYMLERHQRQGNPLPGGITPENVTRRCCREISRPKAKALWERNPWLCLIHRHHPSSPDTNYKSRTIMNKNREVLLDYIKSYEKDR